jgi:hypothetical protein
MATVTAGNTFLQRLIGAAALDTAIYEEVETDPRATAQAFVVVLMASVAAAIGAGDLRGTSVATVAVLSTIALLSWAAWALVTFQVGVRLMPEPETRGNVGETLRTIGFSAAPGLLLVFGMLPGVGLPVFVLAGVWMLVAMIVAVRQALDYRSTTRAVAVCVVGWALAVAFAVVLSALFTEPAG